MSQGRTAFSAAPGSSSEGSDTTRLLRLIREGRSFSGRERHCCFLNTQQGRFADISAASGLDFADDGRGAAVVDWDLDGDLDLWINNRNGPQVRFLRNDGATDHHYLAVRLEGGTSNRDAIGARVEVILGDQRSEVRGQKSTDPQTQRPTRPLSLFKTLRAGNGFLSQSSKWIHFGLGPAKSIERLVVRWPGGDQQIFTGLEPDRRYRLVQGEAEPDPWRGPKRVVSLEPSPLEPPPSIETAHVLAGMRIPLPSMTYEASDGQQTALGDLLGRPVLLSLWATWCSPCISELKSLVAEEQRLRATGLEIVALSVDGIDDHESYGRLDAMEMLGQLQFSYRSGFASEQLLGLLQVVHNRIFDLHEPLGLPASILIDPAGNLVAIYKGPVDVERLLSDIENISLEGEALRRESLPFPGRRDVTVESAPIVPLAKSLAQAGFLDQSLDFAARHQERMGQEYGYMNLMIVLSQALYARGEIEAAETLVRQGLAVDPHYAALHNNLGFFLCAQDKQEEGISHYRQAIEINPDYAIAHYNLANMLQVHDLDSALKHYRRALQVDPEYIGAHTNLALALRGRGELDGALKHLRAVLAIKADDARAHYHLADVLAQQGKLDQAIEHYRQTLRVVPEHVMAHVRLAAVLLRQSDLEGAIGHCQQALAAQPDHALAHQLMGRAQLGQKQFHRAVDHYRQALRHGDNTVETHYGLGLALIMTGSIDESIKSVRQAVDLAPNSPAALNLLARILCTAPEPTALEPGEAIKLAKKAVELTDHGNAKILDTLAAAYAAAGQFDQAITTAQKAIELALAGQNQKLAEQIEKRHKLYQQEKPFRAK